MRTHVAGVGRNRCAAMFNRVVQPTGAAAHLAAIAQIVCAGGCQRYRALEMAYRKFVLLAVSGDCAKQIPRLMLLRIVARDFVGNRLRRREIVGIESPRGLAHRRCARPGGLRDFRLPLLIASVLAEKLLQHLFQHVKRSPEAMRRSINHRVGGR